MMEQAELLKSALTRVAAPPDLWSRIQAPRRKTTTYWFPACGALAMAAVAVFLFVRPAETAIDLGPYLQQSSNLIKTLHGDSVRHVVLNDVDLFIASPKLHLRVGNPSIRSLQFPCSKQMCVAACKRCSEATLNALMTRLTQ